MIQLEELTRGTIIKGILPNSLITVVDAQWHGADVVELTYKDAGGSLGHELVFRDCEATLEIVTVGRPWSFNADGANFRLVSEAHRIRLAHLFDPLLAKDWHPTADKRLTVWEATQHLIRVIDLTGEESAAVLLAQLGTIGAVARDLAYRLYSICDRKGWSQEGVAYNSLVIAWSEVSRLATEKQRSISVQGELDF